jgi:predicted DNA-binding antitoxin AbrB/MazE fold protein
MLSVRGVYENGAVKFNEKVSINGETPVIVTFLEDLEEEETKRVSLSDFSFQRAKEILKDYKGSLSDTVIEERRSFL